jgi:hypothetical protein
MEASGHVGKVIVSDVNRILLKLQIRDQEIEIITKQKLQDPYAK